MVEEGSYNGRKEAKGEKELVVLEYEGASEEVEIEGEGSLIHVNTQQRGWSIQERILHQ